MCMACTHVNCRPLYKPVHQLPFGVDAPSHSELALLILMCRRVAPDFLDLFSSMPSSQQPAEQPPEGAPGGPLGAMFAALDRSAAAVSARVYEDRMWSKCLRWAAGALSVWQWFRVCRERPDHRRRGKEGLPALTCPWLAAAFTSRHALPHTASHSGGSPAPLPNTLQCPGTRVRSDGQRTAGCVAGH